MRSLQRLPADTARKGDRPERDHEKQRRKHDDRNVLARPIDPKTLPDPEHAECGEHDADHELEHVLGDSRERPVNRETNSHNEETGRDRADARGNDQAASCADCDDDENHLQSFEHDGFKTRQGSEPIKPRIVEARLLAQLRRLRRVGYCFVVEGDDACGAQNSLAQPVTAKAGCRSRAAEA